MADGRTTDTIGGGGGGISRRPGIGTGSADGGRFVSHAEPTIERATDVIQVFGCPICGEDTDALTVKYISAIEIFPCGHTVLPEDAIDMQRFYEELWMAEIHESC